MKKKIGEYSVDLAIGHYETIEGGRRWISDGYQEFHFTLDMDIEKIVGLMGQKAQRSKRGISKYMQGAIVLRCTGKKEGTKA